MSHWWIIYQLVHFSHIFEFVFSSFLFLPHYHSLIIIVALPPHISFPRCWRSCHYVIDPIYIPSICASPCHMTLCYNLLSFHLTVFLNCCLHTFFWKHASFSRNSKHKSQNHSHKMQNPLYLLQNATLLPKQCYVTSKGYFVFKRQTQTIIWVDISKHRLNTDVLNGKHYYEWENTSLKALSGALCLFMFSVTVRLLL